LKLMYTVDCDSKGNLIMYHRDKMIAECKEHFSGKRLVITIQEQGSSATQKQIKYFKGYLIPQVKKGMRDVGYPLSERQVESYLMDQYFRGLKWNSDDASTDITKEIFSDRLREIVEWGHEYLGIAIDLPNAR